MSDADNFPAPQDSIPYRTPHSRGLNHVRYLFGYVRGRLPQDDELADDCLRRIWVLFGEYHRRAMEAEDELSDRRQFSPDPPPLPVILAPGVEHRGA